MKKYISYTNKGWKNMLHLFNNFLLDKDIKIIQWLNDHFHWVSKFMTHFIYYYYYYYFFSKYVPHIPGTFQLDKQRFAYVPAFRGKQVGFKALLQNPDRNPTIVTPFNQLTHLYGVVSIFSSKTPTWKESGELAFWRGSCFRKWEHQRGWLHYVEKFATYTVVKTKQMSLLSRLEQVDQILCWCPPQFIGTSLKQCITNWHCFPCMWYLHVQLTR